MGVIEAVIRDDPDSVAFLTTSHLRHHARCGLTFLISGLVGATAPG